MIVLWAFLNIALTIYFLYVCVQAVKFTRRKMGILATLVLVLGLFSFTGAFTGKKPADQTENFATKSWHFTPKESLKNNTYGQVTIEMADRWIHSHDLYVQFAEHKMSGETEPELAQVRQNGLTAGTLWKPIDIHLEPTSEPNQYRYGVVGVEEWTLLGMTIFTKSVSYDGLVNFE